MYTITWKDGEVEQYENKKDFEARLYFLEMICGYAEDKDFKAVRIIDGKPYDWHDEF